MPGTKNGKRMQEERPINDRQRRFCELVVAGRPAGRAYEEAGYAVRGDVADAAAARMLGNDRVQDHLVKLREEAEKVAGMTKDDAIRKLVEIWNSPPSAASMDNPLCELKMSKAGPFATFPDKSRCLDRLAKMLGWDEPEKVHFEFEVVIGGSEN